jgi:hypothetical protein
VALRQVWAKWIDSQIIVKPKTVIDWQNRRFKKHWSIISNKNKKPGRKKNQKRNPRSHLSNGWRKSLESTKNLFRIVDAWV